uniref:Zinc finger protein ZFPM2-like n=1 Tax=Petromyzon marinus TaxID=7757 RepID=A0AAJ7TAY1_PETMA|nr:zinc finger protein ZFPM2-like [Petromyzon marinus]
MSRRKQSRPRHIEHALLCCTACGGPVAGGASPLLSPRHRDFFCPNCRETVGPSKPPSPPAREGSPQLPPKEEPEAHNSPATAFIKQEAEEEEKAEEEEEAPDDEAAGMSGEAEPESEGALRIKEEAPSPSEAAASPGLRHQMPSPQNCPALRVALSPGARERGTAEGGAVCVVPRGSWAAAPGSRCTGAAPGSLAAAVYPTGPTHCVECNISFSKVDNYIVHKTLYCSSRQQQHQQKQKQQQQQQRRPEAEERRSSASAIAREAEGAGVASAGTSGDAGLLAAPTPAAVKIEREGSHGSGRTMQPSVALQDAERRPDAVRTSCAECRITFGRLENYLVHKRHYCASRHGRAGDSASGGAGNAPVAPQRPGLPVPWQPGTSGAPAGQLRRRSRRTRWAAASASPGSSTDGSLGSPARSSSSSSSSGKASDGEAAESRDSSPAAEAAPAAKRVCVDRAPPLPPPPPPPPPRLSRHPLDDASAAAVAAVPMDLSGHVPLGFIHPGQAGLSDYHKCASCQIAFSRLENYLAHKRYYCRATLHRRPPGLPAALSDPQPARPHGYGTLDAAAAATPLPRGYQTPGGVRPPDFSSGGAGGTSPAYVEKNGGAGTPPSPSAVTVKIEVVEEEEEEEEEEKTSPDDRRSASDSPAGGDAEDLPDCPPSVGGGAASPERAGGGSPGVATAPRATGKHCRSCDIRFSSLSNFVAHKRFYCASHAVQ